MKLSNAEHFRWIMTGRLPAHTGKRYERSGVVEAANSLGVSRFHLWAVLNGRRTSASLLRRYKALLQGRAQ